jgi:hypothetical protein
VSVQRENDQAKRTQRPATAPANNSIHVPKSGWTRPVTCCAPAQPPGSSSVRNRSRCRTLEERLELVTEGGYPVFLVDSG